MLHGGDLPGYQTTELIHESARSRVYRAVTAATDEPVVIKFHNSDYPSARALASTKRAFEIGRELNCPGIIRHVALVAHANDLALVTEDYGALSLDRFAPTHPFDLRACLRIAIDLADAVGRLHEHDVVHKDIKPHNIVIHPSSGLVKLIDFDIASRLCRETTERAAPEALEGTLAYLSPEQTGRMNRAVDYRSDLYSLGVTLYELLTGRLPFDATDPMELIHCHIARTPVTPSEIDPRIPSAVSAVILRLLAKTAEERYRSAFGAKHDLELCRDQLDATGSVEGFTLGAQDLPVRFQLPQKLYGREHECAALLAGFERVANGGRSLLLVSGYSGVGKSSLIHEVQKPIVARRGYFCSGKFDQFRSDLPYVGLLGAFRDLVRQRLTERADQIDALRVEIVAALGANGAVITTLLGELALIIGAQPVVPQLGAAESQARFNRVFARFVGVLARAEHPLVLFVDDLQWADLASLQLLEALATDPDIVGLLIVGAYRDNEVARGHPLLATVRHLEDAGHRIQQIELAPLPQSIVDEILADTLCVDRSAVTELAALTYEKTRGNPFFLGEFLQSLHVQRLIYLDAEHRRWCWRTDEIRRAGITDNVADLMGRHIEQLDAPTRRVLELASCIGASFDLHTIAVISEQDLAQTARDLHPALRLGLVIPLDASYKYVTDLAEVAAQRGSSRGGVNPRYRFLHDRVQQAAHARLNAAVQQQTHLDIGRHLLAGTDAAQREEHVIEIVNHLNSGRALIDDPAERVEVARLNLLAGRRAKAAMAVDAATTYFDAGRELLPPDAWQRHYALTLALHTEATDVAYIAMRFEDAATQAETVLSHARDLLDRVPIYNVQIGMGVARNQYVEATDRGLDVLRQFGITLPRRPTMRHIGSGLLRLKLVLRGRGAPALLDLPTMTDPHAQAAMGLLMKSATNAYWGVPNLMPLMAFAMVRLSIRHGNTALSAYGYAMLGNVLSAALGDINGGYAFGQLAADLVDRLGARELIGKTRLLWDGFIRQNKHPLDSCASAMLDDYHAALDVGDVENAGYCVTVAYYTDLFAGRSLPALAERFAPYLQAVRRSQQQQSIQVIDIWTQMVTNLAARDRVEPCLAGALFDMESALPTLRQAGVWQNLAQGGAAAGMLAYLLGDLDRARSNLAIAFQHRDALIGQPHVCGILAYYGLVLCQDAQARRSQRGDARLLRRIRRTLRKAARYNPHSYGPLHELLDAERQRTRGRSAAAAAGFRRTMERARTAGMPHIEALACERLASLHEAQPDRELAGYYNARAAHLYRRWGAHAKVRQLQLQLGGSLTATRVPELVTTDGEDGPYLDHLDFRSVMKSLRTVSSEIQLAKLLTRIMDLVIENAGAQRGVLALAHDDEWLVEADRAVPLTLSSSIGGTTTEANFQRQLLDDYPHVPRAVVDYTRRTKEPVLLESAAKSDLFGQDAYVVSRQPRSILCAPLLHQGELTGIVYLENNLSSGAFAPQHLAVVELLCAQAAVSIQNARLYEHQRALADSFARFVPKQFLQHLGKRSLLDVRLGDAVQREISVLFSDLRDFTALSESLSAADNFALMNSYLARMEPKIQQHAGFIDKYVGDAVMALFPRATADAVHAAIAMQQALAEYNAQRQEKGRRPLRMGIGIHTGPLMLGTLGSPDRMDTTVIGDTVNVASRIEGLTKAFGTALLISGDVHAQLPALLQTSCRLVGRFRVKGKTTATTVYEVLEADPADVGAAKRSTLATFNQACVAYFAGEFKIAREAFERCIDSVPPDRLVHAYVARCERHLARSVPRDWDGIEDLDTK